MTAVSDKRRAVLLGGFFLLIAAAVCVLNIPRFFWEPLPIGFRITVPVLLLAAFATSFVQSAVLRFAGWVGISGFLLLMVYIVFLTDDYIAQGTATEAPHVPSTLAFAWRISIYLVISVLLIVCYGLIGRSRNTDAATAAKSG